MLYLLAWAVTVVLLLFTGRRWLFGLTALLPYRRVRLAPVSEREYPHVLVLAPIRNEVRTLPDLLLALAGLKYPATKLTLVLIDDGSTDGSHLLLQSWAEHRNNWHLLRLKPNMGKAAALNVALDRFAQGELVVVYDADERPEAEALTRLVEPFADPQVGGVSGRRAAGNALASPAASYTAFEGLVHQLVTMRAKDRLNLAPAFLGANCAYRRVALSQAGNFKPGALLEDSDLTVKLARNGWRVRFEPDAVSYHAVPETITGYWKQHTRWARGFNEVAKDQSGHVWRDARLPPALRLELFLFSAGYLDRVALLGGVLLAGLYRPVRRLLSRVLLVSLLTPAFQIIIALIVARASPALWRRTVWIPLFFGLDLAMAVTGLWTTLRRAPQIWEERREREVVTSDR